MLNQEIIWNEELGVATAILKDTAYNEVFVGMARCCEDDLDMKSKMTGSDIAWRRAYIKYLKNLKKESNIQLKALSDFQKSIKNCKYYNEDFQIENMLNKKIKRLENKVKYYQIKIKNESESLTAYINAKDKIYQKIRENRDKNNKRR